MGENIRTIYQPMPGSIGGFTVYMDDFFTVVLNQNHSRERNLEVYAHELAHIRGGDFEKLDANEVELAAHNIGG